MINIISKTGIEFTHKYLNKYDGPCGIYLMKNDMLGGSYFSSIKYNHSRKDFMGTIIGNDIFFYNLKYAKEISLAFVSIRPLSKYRQT